MAPLVYWPVTVSLGETGRSEAAPWSFRREWPGGELGGRLHRDQREELQHVVLHHVAQRARAVIEAHAAFKAHGFGHGDLHMLDMRGVPQRLEHDVGKAQRQKVLHRFLAQIVVDAEDAVFGEGARHGIVDHLGGGQIGAQRLFKADAALLIGQAAVDQTRDGRLEQAGRGGQEDRQTMLHLADLLGQRVEMGRVIGVERLVEQAFQEALDGGRCSGRNLSSAWAAKSRKLSSE
jgi:hypothetical protein